MNRLTFIAVSAAAALLVYVVEMVRRRHLREEYSILWLAGGTVMIVLALKKDWLEVAAHSAGIIYTPAFLFLVAILFILLILIHFSMAISKLHQMNKRMAQEIALLKESAAEAARKGEGR